MAAVADPSPDDLVPNLDGDIGGPEFVVGDVDNGSDGQTGAGQQDEGGRRKQDREGAEDSNHPADASALW